MPNRDPRSRPTRHPFLEGLPPTAHVAHRGGAALAPENTLPAFRQAVERHGTDMIETDVQISRDGVPVIFHDDRLERCTDGEGRVGERTWDELARLDAGARFTRDGRTFPFKGQGVRIPTLEEALDTFPSLRFSLDLKTGPEGVEPFARVLAPRDPGRICCGSEDDERAAELRRRLPGPAFFYPRDAATAFVRSARGGPPPPDDPRWQVLAVPYAWAGRTVVDAGLVRAAARAGRWVMVWTVDDPDLMRALVALGVGGIVTDRPDLLRTVLDRP